MRIATWNINGLRARLDFLRLWLEERQPDVVGLQELKLRDEHFPHDAFAELGYHAVVHGQKSWNGVAILAREPLEPVHTGLPGQQDMGARLITARVGDLDFTTVYCPNGKHLEHEDFKRKLAWYDRLREHWHETTAPDSCAVLCGDFNVCPTDLDTWDPEGHAGRIFHTQDERSRFAALLDEGLFDLFRELHPGERAFSWWDYRGGAFHREHGLRIDFVLGTRPVLERTRDARIDRDWRKKRDGMTASDHAPVVAELD